jgi:hypothetical protein
MIRTLVCAAVCVASAASVSAATLDFNELGAGPQAGSTASITGADLTSGGDAFFVDANFSNSICALDSSVFSCAYDLTIDFTDLVSDIMFDVGGFESGDAIEVLVYGLGSALLGSATITGDGSYDLSAFADVDYLFFDDSSQSSGVDYGNVSYNVASSVPVPASLPLLIAGLGGLFALRRRRA